MYLTTPGAAYRAERGDGRETLGFVPELSDDLCCGPDNRGVAVHDDKVFVATLDALIALNNRTGVVWETGSRIDDGYSETMAPLAYRGKVVVGVDGGEYGIRGSSPPSMREREGCGWHTIPGPARATAGGGVAPTDPYGTSLGRDISSGGAGKRLEAWKRAGGGHHDAGLRPTTNTLYVVVENPAPALDAAARPGDNLYTGSIVALDGDTGRCDGSSSTSRTTSGT